MADRDLKMIVNDRSGGVEITLSGFISERASMDADAIGENKRIVIDAGGVISINSFGVRTWVNFLEALGNKSRDVAIRRMPPALVSQASMVANFLGRARVESFFTPWRCLDCSEETLTLQKYEESVPDNGRCPECNGETEFDEIRTSYLAFREG